MRLVNTATRLLEYFDDSQVSKHPYAILSHAWGPEEVLFHEVQDGQQAIRNKAGWVKMDKFCAMAQTHGFAYAWIDTCCIDKRSSAELSEAINSMYRYYHDAAVCYIYLEDVHKFVEEEEASREQVLTAVRSTRWLSRGWTLQEFVVPARRRFFFADWSEIEGGIDLLDALAESTGIDRTLLEDRSLLCNFCIAERMKWASKRQTTRGEDIAYSLMGLFNVNMPVLYGEGASNAFKRLQREIMEASFDMTIFAWRGDYLNSGFLAQSPANFADIPPLGPWAPWSLAPFSMTNVGLTLRLNIAHQQPPPENKPKTLSESGARLLAALQCDVQTPTGEWQTPMVYLESVEGANFIVNGKRCKAYRRVRCLEWLTMPSQRVVNIPYEDVLILQDEQYELVQQATKQHIFRNREGGGAIRIS
ncbi:HET-domain-containing protein [Hypoxylon crocopeplum]|nr:HET-domain-containing protein [Hypoxylon crocopeplum]